MPEDPRSATEADLAAVPRLIAQPDHLVIDTIAVVPEAQGRGLGRALLAFARRHAAENGLSEIRLSTNVAMTENLLLYPKMGFTETHRAT